MAPVQQRSFDEMGTPLHDVTFCVIDLETTGTSPGKSMITEIGAVKLKGGVCLGTYQTLVDPGCAIPPQITVITGITESMVANAPRIESVTPSLLEFIADSVIVGHNVRFDLSFINATLDAQQRPRLPNRSIDTLGLARRLLRPEVPSCKLGTLDDALATGDLLHLLIERSTALGATGLDDLASLPTMSGGPHFGKLRLTHDLPRSPGVYIFRGRSGRILYVGKAANLRARVRSYFSADQRRKIVQLLRETTQIDHMVCANGLEAAVVEIRLIHRHLPRFNQQGTTSGRYPYVKLVVKGKSPRLMVTSKLAHDDNIYLGPVASRKRARLLIDAIEATLPFGCTAADISSARRDEIALGLRSQPNVFLAPLQEKVRLLAQREDYEKAAEIRDMAAALSLALSRHRLFEMLVSAGEVSFSVDGTMMNIDRGRLLHVGGNGPEDLQVLEPPDPPSRSSDPPHRESADEMLCIGKWITAHADSIRLKSVSGVLAEPADRLASFKPSKTADSRRVASRSVSTHRR